MTEPCDKGPAIAELQKSSIEHGLKVDQVLENQKSLGDTMTAALNRLTSMIEADIGTRKDVEQGKKDIERLYLKGRRTEERVESIEIRNAKCDGLGVFKKWDTVWNFIQQEKGWRRFLPASMAFLSFLILLYVSFWSDR